MSPSHSCLETRSREVRTQSTCCRAALGEGGGDSEEQVRSQRGSWRDGSQGPRLLRDSIVPQVNTGLEAGLLGSSLKLSLASHFTILSLGAPI